MDYSYYSTPAQTQPYHFNAFPPTPAASYEAHEEHGTGPADLFSNSSGYQGFDPSYAFAPNAFLSQDPPSHQQSPPLSNPRQSVVSMTPAESANVVTNGSSISNSNGDCDFQEQNGNHSSSEEKEHESLTPAQQRRKVQNRAAQRAFRERKERHVKDLETKLNSLSAHSSTLLTDNERLKRELHRLATQNEILRATAQPTPAPRLPSPLHGPQTYSPTDFVAAVGVDVQRHPVSFEDFGGEEGQRLLAAGATWDLIQSHELFRRGMVDVSDVCRRLKGRAACDGRGPAFKEAEVVRAIEESVQSGSDELI